MKLVSAAKLRRAQDAMVAARPLCPAPWPRFHGRVAATPPGVKSHPLLQQRDARPSCRGGRHLGPRGLWWRIQTATSVARPSPLGQGPRSRPAGPRDESFGGWWAAKGPRTTFPPAQASHAGVDLPGPTGATAVPVRQGILAAYPEPTNFPLSGRVEQRAS